MKIPVKHKSVTAVGYLMLRINNPVQEEVLKMIDPADLADSGLEHDPHVTILMDVDPKLAPEEILSNARELLPNFDVVLDQVSLFENEDNDVLKWDANLGWLEGYHSELKNRLNVTEHYPDYHPHCTIAYIKSGLGKKYVELLQSYKNIICQKKDINYSLIQEI